MLRSTLADSSVSFHSLAKPKYELTFTPEPPLTPYYPQPGDVVLSTGTNRLGRLAYLLALTAPPTHSGVIVRMQNGELGILESGGGDVYMTRITPLVERFTRPKEAAIWVRKIQTPLTEQESAQLTSFAYQVSGIPYSRRRLLGQGTVFRSRGPIRTFFIATPKGVRDNYFCSEVVLEALVHAGLVDRQTARPRATYPYDFFYDRSQNLYIHMHPPLACRWAPPALWVQADSNPPCSK